MVVPYLNAIYSVFSYGMKRYAGIPFNPPLPPAVSIELSSVCNLACPECVTGAGLLRRKNDFMDYSLAEMISGKLRGHILSAWLYGQGEPMLHPQFFEIAGLFRGMHTAISTNGHFLDEDNCRQLVKSGIGRVIISYDGATAETYNIYRAGGDHASVTEGIRRLAEMRDRLDSQLKIEIQLLLHRHNEHEAEKAASFARSVGAGFALKSMQVLDADRAGEWMPSDTRKARYVNRDGTWKAAAAPARGCIRMWTAPVITTDGDVLPCCFDKYAGHVMGNLGEMTFRDIWRSRRYALFRSDIMRSRTGVDICTYCPQGRRLSFRR
jgi:radical SAM protein with 4Fe4S-binding SPASM domain